MAVVKIALGLCFVTVLLGCCLAAKCNYDLRDELEKKCESSYDEVSDSAQDIEDSKEREQALCCALQDLEDCSYEAYDVAHCKDEKPALRENLKAARLFLSVISNVTCNEYKAKCSSTAERSTANLAIVLVALSVAASRL